jgi:hypothetical protein
VGVQKRKEDLKQAEEGRKAAAEAARWEKLSYEERDMEQNVPCDFGEARRQASKLDKAGFGSSALRLITKYRQVCAKNSPAAEVAALANDEALIHYHQGDDGACLKVLTGFPDDIAGAAFNRALCGGMCSLDSAKCAKAADARRKALATRELQRQLREKTQGVCTKDPGDWALLGRNLPDNLGWTLRSEWSLRFVDRKGLIWAGDLNGDGLGDYIAAWDGYWRDTSNAALDNRLPPGSFEVVRWRAFQVSIGCPKFGAFANVLERNTEFAIDSDEHPNEPDNKIAIRVLEQPGRAVRSVCIYPSRNLKCTATKCNREPDQCADLSEWESIEKQVRKRP